MSFLSFTVPGPNPVNCGSHMALNCKQCGRGRALCGGDCTWNTWTWWRPWYACVSKALERISGFNNTEEINTQKDDSIEQIM